LRAADGNGEVPAALAALPPGRHDARLGTLTCRVAVLERGGTAYYLLDDTSLQAKRERHFAWMLGLLALAMTLLSALGGSWLSRTVVLSVSELAAKVRHRSADDWEQPLAEDFPDGEVGKLARVFDRHLIRMRAFIARERAFGTDISQELRTALAVILSTTEVLLDDERLNDKQKARIARIERAARDMAELGTALLLMSREERSLAASSGCVVAGVVREVVEKQSTTCWPARRWRSPCTPTRN
jgi:signal transduction histidine kinase